MSWITAEPNPPDARPLPEFRMFGIMGTWMEGDVIAATIRNAMTQGCERVYLVDNGSPDDTVPVALREGAVLARSFETDQHDELLLRGHLNAVVADVSASEPADHIWWLFLDADEFSHGPHGLTLRDYLATLDERFRVVGARCFDHYPSGRPQYVQERHPLDFQPLCEELAFAMCPAGHRKHPLQRYDRGGPPIECGRGLHRAHCAERLLEPLQPAFLHHFPFRDEHVTRRRLETLWAKDRRGISRGSDAADCVHMRTRFQSLDAVYAQDWANVENFIARDPMYAMMDSPPPPRGVRLTPWAESVEAEHQHVLRWYPMLNAWNYGRFGEFRYGDDVTYRRGMAFLDGHGTIEDWGCGFAHARQFVTKSAYVGVDGSSPHADTIADLREYRSQADCIFMRHVLEHNTDWRRILANAVASFRKRMVLVLFTPLADRTRQIATSDCATSIPVPDISFRREDVTRFFDEYRYVEEALVTDTQYQTEHIFYVEKT